MTAAATELVNRPGIGLSELGSALTVAETLVREGAAKGVFAKAFADEWKDLFTTHRIGHAARVLNTQDFPDMQRSKSDILDAVIAILSFGGAVRERWGEHAWAFAAMSTLGTALNWIMQLSALSVPGVWPAALADVPNVPDKTAMLRQPGKGKPLAAFLAACVEELGAARGKKRGASAAAKISTGSHPPKLSFSDSESASPEPTRKRAKKPQRAAKRESRLAQIQREILALEIEEGCTSIEAIAILNWAKELGEEADALVEAGEGTEKWDGPAVQAHVKVLSRAHRRAMRTA